MIFTIDIPDRFLRGLQYLKSKYETRTGSTITMGDFISFSIKKTAEEGRSLREHERISSLEKNYLKADDATQDKIINDASVTLGTTIP